MINEEGAEPGWRGLMARTAVVAGTAQTVAARQDELCDAGMLTDKEFAAKKAKLLP